MQQLFLLGLNHTTAPLEVREKLALNSEQRDAALPVLRAKLGLAELVLLSTCNRVELYMVRDGKADQPDETFFVSAVEALAEIRSLVPMEIEQHLYRKTDRTAVEHLFAVAASLDSMVLGETQILGQVRQAYERAQGLGAAGSILHPLFQQAIASSREVMARTSLASGRSSVASVAVDYANRIFDTFSDKTVLSIGAGKMSELVLRQFAQLQPGRLLVCNRDVEKASALAQQYNGVAVALDQLTEHLIAADVVISATGSQHPIITRKVFDGVLKQRRYKSVFLIDLALPRDIEASVGDADNVFLYNLDDLQQVILASQGDRRQSIDAARAIVAENVAHYLVSHRSRELGPLIDRLYQRQHEIAQRELERMMGKLPSVSEAEKQHLSEFARRLVNKLLHDPVRALRASQGQHATPQQYAHALEMLYGLQDDAGEPRQSPPVEEDKP